MTLLDEAAPATALDPTAAQRWRRARGPVAIGVVLVLVTLLGVALTRTPQGGYLDPGATTGEGAQAVARVVAAAGVPVTRARTVEQALDAPAGGVLLVARPELLPPGSVARLLAGTAADLVVVVGPDPAEVPDLAPGVTARGPVDVAARVPACDDPLAGTVGRVELGGTTFDVGRAPAGSVGCFAVGGEATYLSLPAAGGRPAVVLLGSGTFLANDVVGRNSNAALALRLAGAGSALTWLLPRPEDLLAAPGERRGILGLLPGWVVLGAAQLGVAVVVVALWRARRLGPVVAEPLPVVVRAAESVEGRGRLYRRSRARDRAAAALRGGALARLTARLGLPPDAAPHAVVSGVVGRTRRAPDEVGGLLYGAAPPSDDALVAMATALDELVAALRDPVPPTAPRPTPTPEDRTP